MGEYNSDDDYIYYYEQESFRRNWVVKKVKKKKKKNSWDSELGRNLKNDRMISVRFQGKHFNITVIQVYAPITDAEEVEADLFFEDLQEFLELTAKK